MKINEDEISKFTKIADEWWDRNGPFKMLHEINPIRLNFILDNLNDEQLESINILDVGCGGGILCESLAKNNLKNANITGIDPGFENIQIAKEHSKKSNLNINYIDTSLENFESETKFDIVISFEVIEHCENYKTFLKQLSHLLKPNGLLFLSTINRNFKSYLQAIIAAEYILKWIPKKTHEWKKFLKPSEINRILEKENIKIQKIKGMKFDLFSQSWCECDDINVNYMLVAQKK
jgi:2-polyprenyl-6-hydroxyphenyl methylase/3-demethylubiquinone-9 3-methyltransferase